MKTLILTWLLIADFTAGGQMAVLFEDRFIDNRNDWQLVGPDYSASIASGHFDVAFKTNDSHIIGKDLYFNGESDYEIECVITQRCSSRSGYGLIWGHADSKAHYRFLLTSYDSEYAVIKVEGDRTHYLQGWSYHEQVGSFGSRHKLLIRKRGEYMHFFINDNEVFRCPAQGFMGNGIGFFAGTDMQLDIEYVVVRSVVT